MLQGKILEIYIAMQGRSEMKSVPSAIAVSGKGLEGDRYCRGQGTFSRADSPEQEITLIECEAIEAVLRDYEISISPAETRRNLVTSEVPLNHLVGRDFWVGSIRLRGLKLCEPCGHLEQMTGKNVVKMLRHRGGLRARIVTGGEILVGDSIRATGNHHA
jgi:MOSC domain-containing protein YiiM